jgi:methylmalonyl-CoA mutase C-terminal domain/subunit
MADTSRILVAKVGLDGHDRGAKVVVRALREAGFDVRYTGLHLEPRAVARAAVDLGANLLGLSIHSGAHAVLVPEVLRHLCLLGAGDLPVIVGGTVPEDDRRALLAQGVRAVFVSGASMSGIVACTRTLCADRNRLGAAV